MMSWLPKRVFHPLLDLKRGSIRLKAWRALQRTQWKTRDALEAQQWERLCAIVRYAHDHCDYYRELFRQHRIDPDIDSPQAFRRIPWLTKATIASETDRLIAGGYRKQDLVTARTGGSTGTALQIYFDRRWQEVRTADAMRADGWASWELGMKTAAVWGNPPVPTTWRDRILSAAIERTIYLDTMNLSPKSMADFVARWRKFRPDIVFGHAHSIFMFAKYVRDQGIRDLRAKGIVSTSMMLLESERSVIEHVFGCKVTNRYGCEEVGLIACECERHEGMHLNIEHLYIEFLDEHGEPVKPGQEGLIVVTDLYNRGMPLIRYRVEDVGVPSDRECSCGRGLPLMERVTGRTADFLKRRDGSQVAGVSLVERTLTAIPGIEQMQIVQEELEHLTINLVVADRYDASGEAALRRELGSVFGDGVTIDLRYVERLGQERSSKYRFSICKV